MSSSYLKRKELHHREGKHYWYYFSCICGNRVIKRSDKKVISCGCVDRERKKKTKFLDSAGYVMRSFNGIRYVREHRYLMEEFLGRKLKTKEQIHHINGDKTDNRIENLQLLDSLTHNRIECGWKIIKNKWYKVCPCCKKELEVSENNFYKCKLQFFWICKTCASGKNKKLSTAYQQVEVDN